MLFKNRVKAGILLYALLMSSLFLLLVQVYLEQVNAFKREYILQIDHSRVYMMAEYIRQSSLDGSGQVIFDSGTVHYQTVKNNQKLTVKLTSGASYQLTFPIEEQGNKTQLNQGDLKP